MTEKTTGRLTEAQGRVLLSIERGDGPFRGVRSNTGGAIRRMCERMREAGLLEWPYKITPAGMTALEEYKQRLAERERRFLRKGGR
jgi:hypothetical protein